MATPGHPYDTKELEKQRAEQRRRLRMIDTHVVVETRQNGRSPEVQREDDVLLVEQTLRDLADADAAEVGEERLSKMAAGELASVMKDPMQGMVLSGPNLGNFMPDVGRLARGYVQAAEDLPQLESVIRPLVRMVAFLIQADRLAGDYMDPRVKWAEANR